MYRRQRHIYDLTRKFYLLGRDELIARTQSARGRAVLEIACGTGRNLIRAARRYPQTRLLRPRRLRGDAGDRARAKSRRAGLAGRIKLARGDATAFDPQALFGVASIRARVHLLRAVDDPATGARRCRGGRGARSRRAASLHIVDFGDCAGLPRWVRGLLGQWLALFGVHAREELEDEIGPFAAARDLRAEFRPLYHGYAFLVRLSAR